MNTRISTRPAIAAIAAVLVLATPVGAQQIAPSDPADASAQPAPEPSLPPIAPETQSAPAPETASALPQVSAPATPTYSAPAPVVQAVPVTPPQASAAPVLAPAATARPAPKIAATAPLVATAARAPAPRLTPTTPVATAPQAETVVPSTPPLETAQPATAAPSTLSNSDVTYGLVGGGAAIVLLGGLTVYALRRRRAPVDATTVRRAPVATKTLPPAPAVAEPVAARSPAALARAATAKNPQWPELEDMVAAVPDASNPFLTRSKRMRRATFLLEQGEPQPIAAVAAAKPAKAPVRARQTETKPQPVYTFSSTRLPGRVTWKPATT